MQVILLFLRPQVNSAQLKTTTNLGSDPTVTARGKNIIGQNINIRYISSTDYNKSMLNKASKQYKNTINFHVNNYRHHKAKKLRSMATKRPKHYWKFLKGLKRKARDNNGPILNEFYDYYKNINNNDAGVSQSTDISQFNQSDLELNSPILLPEIEKCILNLNNGKSSSPIDEIINEYLKYSKELLLPLLTKLFNCF